MRGHRRSATVQGRACLVAGVTVVRASAARPRTAIGCRGRPRPDGHPCGPGTVPAPVHEGVGTRLTALTDAVDAVLGTADLPLPTVGSRRSASSATNSGLLTGLGVLELSSPGMDRGRRP